jgi:hypothetical protein
MNINKYDVIEKNNIYIHNIRQYMKAILFLF